MSALDLADRPLTQEPDEVLDRFARMATRALQVPVSLVTVVEETRQRFPGAVGLPEHAQTARESPLSQSICQYVQGSGRPFVTSDIRTDERVLGTRAGELGVVAYAGVPLRATLAGEDHAAVVGVLCAIDDKPREWTPEHLALLEDLAAACSTELQLREAEVEARTAERNARLLLLLTQALAEANTLTSVAAAVRAVARREIHANWVGLMTLDAGRHLLELVDGRDLGIPEHQRSLPVDGPSTSRSPLHQALRSRQVLVYPTAEHVRAAFPVGTVADVLRQMSSVVVVPLMNGREALGIAVATWDEELDLGADVTLLEGIGRIIAQSLVRAGLQAARRSAAQVLQQSLLTRLPEVPWLDLYARYVTAGGEAIGGDWYDALLDTDDSVSVAIGDVTGHDVRAAATMGQLRGTLRAFAADRSDDPAGLVQRLDRTLPTLQISGMATLVAGRFEKRAPGAVTFCWTNAGHPPPVVLHRDQTVDFLGTRPELLVGVLPDVDRTTHHVDLAPGDTLLLFTDGLVEHRGRSLATGLQHLQQALSRHSEVPLPDLLEQVILDLVGGHPDDDCALLAIRLR
ncbi:GAF domain-containing SpoIIE family protein phosphatase [Kineococcus gynurae]|uniref:GAF domain-containing SpoIIE family protein phosphatase n=1 Tax=Kineococcus gynurae TaxID=452979 RepID=A0ABV5LSA4_9ACTN